MHPCKIISAFQTSASRRQHRSVRALKHLIILFDNPKTAQDRRKPTSSLDSSPHLFSTYVPPLSLFLFEAMSTPFRGRYSPASRGGGNSGGNGSGRGGNSGEYRGNRGGAGGSSGRGGQYPRGGGRGDRGSGGNYQRGGGGRGGAGEGGRGGGFARGGGHGGSSDREAPKKESILDLGQYMDREIYVKFNGGREGQYYTSSTRSAFLSKSQSFCH